MKSAMSLERRDRAPSGDERKVSFTLPHAGRAQEREAPAASSPSSPQCEKVENEWQEDPSVNDDAAQNDCHDSICFPNSTKHKKKWKIKLPWSRNKKQKILRQYNVEDIVNEDGSGDDNEKENRRSISSSESDLERQPKIENKKSPQRSPKKSPQTRPFSWTGEPLAITLEEDEKNETEADIHHTISVEVLEEHSDGPVPTSKRPKIKLKGFRAMRKKEHENINSFSYDSSFDVDAFLTAKDGKERKSENNFIHSQPNVNVSESKFEEIQRQKLGKRFSDSKFVENLNFIEADEPKNIKDARIKKSSSLPSIFRKKKKSKDLQAKKNPKLSKEAPERLIQPKEDTETDGTPGSTQILKDSKNNPSHHSTSRSEKISQISSLTSLDLVDTKTTQKTKEDKNSSQVPLKSFESDTMTSKPFETRPKSMVNIEAKFNKHFPPIDNTPKESLKFIDFFNFKKTSHVVKPYNKRAASEEILTEEIQNKALSQSFDLRIRRKSYEEMINLLEEEMFDQNEWSDDESTDSDGEQVDLSFNKLLESYGVGIDTQASTGFKLQTARDCNSSSSEKEIVYEPKIAKMKRVSASSPLENGKKSPTLKRPLAAPPPPPEEFVGPTDKGILQMENGNTSSLLQMRSGKTEGKERPKKKTHRKIKKVKVNLSTSSSSSLEEKAEPTFTNRALKMSSFEGARGRRVCAHPFEEELIKRKSLIQDRSENDSPPNFPPPPVPDDDDDGFADTSCSSLGKLANVQSHHLTEQTKAKIDLPTVQPSDLKKLTTQNRYSEKEIFTSENSQDEYWAIKETNLQTVNLNNSPYYKRKNNSKNHHYFGRKTELQTINGDNYSGKQKAHQTSEYGERGIIFQSSNVIGYSGDRIDPYSSHKDHFTNQEEDFQSNNVSDYSSKRGDLQLTQQHSDCSLRRLAFRTQHSKFGQEDSLKAEQNDYLEEKCTHQMDTQKEHVGKMEVKTNDQKKYFDQKLNGMESKNSGQNDYFEKKLDPQQNMHNEHSKNGIEHKTTCEDYSGREIGLKMAGENESSFRRNSLEKNYKNDYFGKRMEQTADMNDYSMNELDLQVLQNAIHNEDNYFVRENNNQTTHQIDYSAKRISHQIPSQNDSSAKEIDYQRTHKNSFAEETDEQTTPLNKYTTGPDYQTPEKDYSARGIDYQMKNQSSYTKGMGHQMFSRNNYWQTETDLRINNSSNYFTKPMDFHQATQQNDYSSENVNFYNTKQEYSPNTIQLQTNQNEYFEKNHDNQALNQNDYSNIKINLPPPPVNDTSVGKVDPPTTENENVPKGITNNTSMKQLSAAEVAKDLFAKKNESKIHTIDHEDKYLTHLPIKNIKSSLQSGIFPSPTPPALPPPMDDPFSGSLSSLLSSDLEEQPNSKYKADFSTHNRFTGRNSPPSFCVSSYREGKYDPIRNDGNVETKSLDYNVNGPNLLLGKDKTSPQFSSTTPLCYDNQQVSYSSYNPLREEFVSTYNSLPLLKQDEGHKESKRNIVTFHLPHVKNSEGSFHPSPPPIAITYHTSKEEQVYENVQQTKTEVHESSEIIHSRKGIQEHPRSPHVERKFDFSPMDQHQGMSMQQESLKFRNVNFDSTTPSAQRKENRMDSEIPRIGSSSSLPHSYGNSLGRDSHAKFARATGPIPYSKQTHPLKSILRNSNKYNYDNKLLDENRQTTTPDVISSQQPSSYISTSQPLSSSNSALQSHSSVSGEVSNVYRQQVINKVVHLDSANRSSFNSAVERVEIVDETTDSELDVPPPPLPSYPPPPSRPLSFHQQEFFGDLLHSSSVSSDPRPRHSGGVSSGGGSYYVPTIVEGTGLRAELDSVYQNVIYASQV